MLVALVRPVAVQLGRAPVRPVELAGWVPAFAMSVILTVGIQKC